MKLRPPSSTVEALSLQRRRPLQVGSARPANPREPRPQWILGGGTDVSAQAFTLLEVLIATMIFATVLASVNAVFYGALHLRTKTSKIVEDSIPLNRAATFIRRDLQGIVPPGETLAGPLISGTQPTGLEEFGGLEVYTSSGITDDLQHPWGDIQRVGYYLKRPTNMVGTVGKDLVRLLSRNLLATVEEFPMEQRLLNGVERLQFFFLSGMETEWRDYWNSTNEETVLPKAIKVRLEFATDPRQQTPRRLPFELVVPVLAQKRTNSTETAQSEATAGASNGGGGGGNPAGGGGGNNAGGGANPGAGGGGNNGGGNPGAGGGGAGGGPRGGGR